MKGFIGSGNIDTTSRLCMSSSVAGHVRAFGEDVVPGCYDDLEEADLVIQVGSNMAWCHPVLYQRLMDGAGQARHQDHHHRSPAHRHGGDRRSASGAARRAPMWCCGAALVYLANHNHLDKRHGSPGMSRGFEETLEARASRAHDCLWSPPPPACKTRRCSRAFYEMFAATERVVTLYSQGVNQSSSGTDKVNAILNCHLATGAHRPSRHGPFSLTGQPNAMGGREVGGLANQLAAPYGFHARGYRPRGPLLALAAMAAGPGLKAVDLFEAVGDGRVKAVWIAATNPADSMPRAGKVREALKKCPLVIVADVLAHRYHRPGPYRAAGRELGRKGRHRHQLRTPHLPSARFAPGPVRRGPTGGCSPKWAAAWAGKKSFGWQVPADIFREHAALSALRITGARVFNHRRLGRDQRQRI